MQNNREFDIIIWGASGFTGRLVAEYMLRQYGTGDTVKWAMGGRNSEKLKGIQNDLGATGIPLVIADSNKMDTLEQMVQRTKVICTTVGPYAKYGSLLVEACVKYQTDYCDLTGEVQWIRKMIDQQHDAAQANGTRIVHTCGFDSIPSDMGVYFLQKEAKERTGQYCQHVKFRLKAAKGGISGGTYASLNNVLVEAEKDKVVYTTLSNPYGLNPVGQQTGKDRGDLKSVLFDEDAKSWITPFIMATINTRVVRRSHALQNFPYGKDFQYDEATMTGSGFSGRAKGNVMLMTTGLMMSAKSGSFLKNTMNRFLPKPGEGPSKAKRESGFYKILLIGKFADGSLIQGSVTGDRDPGYGSTSKMLAESAVCLALDKDKTPQVSGVLTPAVALGDVLLERLEKYAGLQFKIYEG